MKSFDEGFYTRDYDQEILDFIDENYNVDIAVNGWGNLDLDLGYNLEDGDFYLIYDCSENNLLTKEEFKRKIGMTPEEEKIVEKSTFSKSDLVDGMVVEIREPFEEVSLYLVKGELLLSKKGHNLLEDYKEDLTLIEEDSDFDIVKVYTVNMFRSLTLENLDKTLIWERPPEKTPTQLKLESLQQKMESLQEEMDSLQKSIETGE